MKFKLLHETRFAKTNTFKHHYDRHVAKDYNQYFSELENELIEPMSMDEYDDNGDILSKVTVKTSDFNTDDRYVGFVMDNGRILKCDKELSEIVIYKSASPKDNNTITYYKVDSFRLDDRYQRLKRKHYFRDIIADDDKYNI